MMLHEGRALERKKIGHHENPPGYSSCTQRDRFFDVAHRKPACPFRRQHSRHLHGAVTIRVGLDHWRYLGSVADQRSHRPEILRHSLP
jgi:hypothetical protein